MPIPLSPSHLIACAAGIAAPRDRQTRAERDRRYDPNADDVASAAFVHHAGYHAHLDHDTGSSSWPLPRTATAMELAAVASRAGALSPDPQPGDIALSWSAQRSAYVHAAIVVRVIDPASPVRGAIRCRVLDPGADGSRARVTTFNPDRGDRFLRWVTMHPPD